MGNHCFLDIVINRLQLIKLIDFITTVIQRIFDFRINTQFKTYASGRVAVLVILTFKHIFIRIIDFFGFIICLNLRKSHFVTAANTSGGRQVIRYRHSLDIAVDGIGFRALFGVFINQRFQIIAD